jgi:hypothetical protein
MKDTKIKIERGIPITRCSAQGLYAPVIRKMKVGDSFAVPLEARAQMCSIFKRIGMKCATRKVDKDSGLIRVWRTK